MVLRRWEPFRELVGMRGTVDRFLEHGSPHPHGPWVALWSNNTLSLDAYETPESLVIKAAVPGVRPEDVDVTVTGNVLTIKGEAGSEGEVEERSYLIRERRYGAFSRTLNLPKGLKTDEIEATYGEGVLTLTIPKAEDTRPKAVKVNVKNALEGDKAA
ncbi:MAG: Hsp20/alpha crystallin family protein [Chloroflexi bacterium]|nr:Hsp20/alpha crystallin family protein [Chloroflexota bacterium]